jgi:site-specific DNA-methyltransferase (adenine-specific)
MILSESPKIQAFNIDCMDFMRDKPDNYYDLAIVDPPYGIGILSQFNGADKTNSMFKQTKGINHGEWDNTPPGRDYFIELSRVSTNQIIWGGNYFLDHLGSTRCMISWDKMNGTNNMADFEIAWASFDSSCRRFSMHHFSAGYDEKIHPTQKPVALYRWLLKNYAKPNDKILDTHGGSFSSAIACQMEGFDLDICELDEDYFNDAVKRFKLNTVQEKLF